MDERRRYQRYQMSEEVYCEILVGEGSSYKALLYDVSSDGARLYFEQGQEPELAIGEKIKVYNYSKGEEYLYSNSYAHAMWYNDSYYGIQYDSPIVDSQDKLIAAYPDAKAY